MGLRVVGMDNGARAMMLERSVAMNKGRTVRVLDLVLLFYAQLY